MSVVSVASHEVCLAFRSPRSRSGWVEVVKGLMHVSSWWLNVVGSVAGGRYVHPTVSGVLVVRWISTQMDSKSDIVLLVSCLCVSESCTYMRTPPPLPVARSFLYTA